MANSSDRTSSIMDLKFNRELYTADLEIYLQAAHPKSIEEIWLLERYLFWNERKVFRVAKVFRSLFGKT